MKTPVQVPEEKWQRTQERWTVTRVNRRMTRNSEERREARPLPSECLTLLGCWAPFWTGTEKGELTRGSGWPAPPPRTDDMLGAARGTSTFPGSSWAEPPEGVAWTGETDWAKRGNRREGYKTTKQACDPNPYNSQLRTHLSGVGRKVRTAG